MRTHTEDCRLVNSTSIIAWRKYLAKTKGEKITPQILIYLFLHCFIKQTNKRTHTLLWGLVLSKITSLGKLSNHSCINYGSSRLFLLQPKRHVIFPLKLVNRLHTGFKKLLFTPDTALRSSEISFGCTSRAHGEMMPAQKCGAAPRCPYLSQSPRRHLAEGSSDMQEKPGTPVLHPSISMPPPPALAPRAKQPPELPLGEKMMAVLCSHLPEISGEVLKTQVSHK